MVCPSDNRRLSPVAPPVQLETPLTEQTLTDRPQTGTDPHDPGRKPRLALAIILTCQLMLMLDATVMNVALPRIHTDLHFSATGLAWVLDAYTLTFGGLLLLGGRLGDLAGRRRVFVAGITVFTIASLAGGLATSAAWLLTARVVQGIAAAAAGPSALALLTSTFTEQKERIRALAVFSGISSAGFAIGLIVGGLLTEWANWRWVMFINVPLGIAAVALAPRYLRQPPQHQARLDLPGAVTATTGTGALVYALIHAATAGWSDPVTVVTLAGGTTVLVIFALIQARTAQPLVPLHLFADRNRTAAYLNFLLGPAAGMSMFFFLTQFLQEVRGYSALETGFAFLPMAAIVFAISRLIPRLLSRFGPKPIALTGTILMASGLAWLTQLTTTSTYATDLLGPMVLIGLGMGLAFSPLNVLIMSTVPSRDAGAASGTLQMMQQVGATLGLAVLVTVYGTAARHAHAHPMVSGMTTAFLAATLIAVVTVLVAMTFRPLPTPAAEEVRS